MTYSSSDRGILRCLSPIHPRQSTSYSLPTNREVVIGRDQGCEIVIDSSQFDRVSRRYAAIRPLDPTSTDAKEWIVYDLNSANGTYINGQQLQGGQVLRGGDLLVLSKNGPEFIFEYQPYNQSTPSPQRPSPATNAGGSTELIKLNQFWIERSPTRLVIHHRDPTRKETRTFLRIVVTILIVLLTILLALPMLVLLAIAQNMTLTVFILTGHQVAQLTYQFHRTTTNKRHNNYWMLLRSISLW